MTFAIDGKSRDLEDLENKKYVNYATSLEELRFCSVWFDSFSGFLGFSFELEGDGDGDGDGAKSWNFKKGNECFFILVRIWHVAASAALCSALSEFK